MIIYKITNTITGKSYIGQTIMPLLRRWRVHKSAKRNTPLCNSIRKHGADKFTLEVLCAVLSKEYLDEMEIHFIKYYNTLAPNGYNLLAGGNASQCRGLVPWNKGKTITEEARKNLSEAHKGQVAWNKGLKASVETRIKQSEAKKGKRVSPNTEFKKGQPSVFKGKKHTAEALAKISANGNRRQVQCIETGEVFTSMKAAAEHYKIAKSYFQKCIKMNRKVFSINLMFKFI